MTEKILVISGLSVGMTVLASHYVPMQVMEPALGGAGLVLLLILLINWRGK